MGQRPLEDWQIKRINQLAHDQKLAKKLIAKRLGISMFAIRRHLLSAVEWKVVKARLNV